MPTQIMVARDGHLTPVWGIPFPDDVSKVLLPADTVKTVTVPTGANLAIFGFSTADCYVGTATFSLPGSTVTSGTDAVVTPSAKTVVSASTLYIRSRSACDFSVEFFTAQV